MSSFLCFICHSTVNKETNEETRDKYREVVGINLCPDSQLCYICCHVLNKLSLFRSICLKRSLEYPVLFREKGTLNLQKSDLEVHILCPEDCNQYQRSKFYQFSYSNDNDTNYNNDNQYVKLEHENGYHEYLNQCQYQNVENNEVKEENNYYVTENIDVNTDVANNDTDIESNEEVNENESTLSENAIVNTDLEIIIKNEVNESEHNLFNVENGNNDNETKGDNDKNILLEDLNRGNDKKFKNKKVKKKKKFKKSKKKGFNKTILTIEEQKAELEANRKEKKYIEAEFKCYNCALGFLFKDTYQAHMMRHEESNGEHQCSTCTLRFASPALLRAHAANHAERHTCLACGVALRPRAARAHRCGEGDAGGGRVACHVCGSLFRDANGLQQHIRRVHTSKASGRLHSCGVCGDSFNTQAALRTHMIKHVKRSFPCAQCGALYSSPYTRAQHERAQHERGGARPALACACGALYASRKSLVAHQRTHASHQQTLFECPICNRICPNQRSLASHVQRVHSASAEHACPACPARYTSRKSLLRHMNKHNKRVEVKMAVCYLCGNSFKGNNKLNRHLREVCEKAKLEEQISELYE